MKSACLLVGFHPLASATWNQSPPDDAKPAPLRTEIAPSTFRLAKKTRADLSFPTNPNLAGPCSRPSPCPTMTPPILVRFQGSAQLVSNLQCPAIPTVHLGSIAWTNPSTGRQRFAWILPFGQATQSAKELAHIQGTPSTKTRAIRSAPKFGVPWMRPSGQTKPPILRHSNSNFHPSPAASHRARPHASERPLLPALPSTSPSTRQDR